MQPQNQHKFVIGDKFIHKTSKEEFFINGIQDGYYLFKLIDGTGVREDAKLILKVEISEFDNALSKFCEKLIVH